MGYSNRGNVYKQLKNKKAFEDFATAIRLSPHDPRPYLDRAKAYVDDKDYERAIQDFDAVTCLDAKNPKPFFGRGEVYAQKMQYEKAIGEYSEAIRLDPRNPEGYLKRSEIYLKKGDLNKSMEDSGKWWGLIYESLPRFGDFPPFDELR